MNSFTAIQASLEVAKSGEPSDESCAFLKFLYLRPLRPQCFICFLNFPNVPMCVVVVVRSIQSPHGHIEIMKYIAFLHFIYPYTRDILASTSQDAASPIS